MRILIVKLGSIGDVVHTLPALAAIKARVPDARVSWVVERGAAEVLRDNPMLDELIEIDTRALRRERFITNGEWSLARQIKRLRANRYDIAIDFQGLLKSALIARLARASRRVGFSRASLREPASRFLMNETVEVPARAHIIERNLALVAGALKIDPPQRAEYQFPVGVLALHEEQAAQAIMQLSERGDVEPEFAILNPGGGWWTKQWSAERFGTLADLLWEGEGLRSAITFGPGEEELAARVVAASRTGAAQGVSLPLRSYFALARRAQVYVGGDTGPTHIAIAAGAPIVGIFGPTEWWRNGSLHTEDTVVERTDVGCRENCHRRECAQWVCMDIEVAQVYGAVRERLKHERLKRERLKRERAGRRNIFDSVVKEIVIGA